MITKIKSLKNLAVFKEFEWDKSIQNKNGEVVEFKELNIFYGRNYSGKTSLSRLIDALNTGKISDKYEDLECVLCFDDETEVNQENFKNHNETVRVFNEDFIKRNLKLINNPEENALPIAIMGEGGIDAEEKINELKKQLGKNENKEKTGLYKDLENEQELFSVKKSTYSDAKTNLEKLLSAKATGKDSGIKYQAKYNKVNYDIRDLKKDIIEVKKKDYVYLSEQQVARLDTLLKESIKENIPELSRLKLSFRELSSETEHLVTRKIVKVDKIEELVKNATLNRWVEKGMNLHKGKRNICAFCNNEIGQDRWSELDRHFDEKSEKLKAKISTLIERIKKEEKLIKDFNFFTEEAVYSYYIKDCQSSLKKLKAGFDGYLKALTELKSILEERQNDIINEKKFNKSKDFSSEIRKAISELDTVKENSNNYTSKLTDNQNVAREKLRLNEIYNFIKEIKYDEENEKLKKLKEEKNKADEGVVNIQNKISDIQREISDLQISLGEESIGAEKINQYLNNHFGNEFLKIEPIKVFDKETQNKISRFEIQRGNKKAYHLSEGEKSLLAFCYFIAKLEDIETKDKNPIIWIDDPISSLDSNHIFFIYSLIKSEIFNKKEFKQLFVSTHNLNFLKYLKRLPSHNFIKNEKVKYFLIERIGEESVISEMPKYLKKNVTEFNHLFKKIYECSTIDRITDDNYTTFYDFGNNARKFFEIYLFYKYPDFTNDNDKLKRFFGEDNIPVILTDRINNEYSHLVAQFERGQQPVEVPEMKKVAQLIIEKIEANDPEQYESLVKSLNC